MKAADFRGVTKVCHTPNYLYFPHCFDNFLLDIIEAEREKILELIIHSHLDVISLLCFPFSYPEEIHQI